MSADNYYSIQNNPRGHGFVAVMGFASDETFPRPDVRQPVFATKDEAIAWAVNDCYTEYGVQDDTLPTFSDYETLRDDRHAAMTDQERAEYREAYYAAGDQ